MLGREVVTLASDVWRIPTVPASLVNCYALRDRDGAITLVDAGPRWSAPRVLSALRRIGAQPEQLRRIVVTQSHASHAGAVAALAAATGAQVYAHEREAIYLREGRLPQMAASGSGLAGALLRRGARRMLRPAAIAGEFRDGDLIAGGIRVIYTPGHTPGHVSLLHEDSGVLLVGDALVNLREVRFPPPWLCTDAGLNARSADRLADLDFDVVAFAHGAEIRRDARQAVRAFLRGRLR